MTTISTDICQYLTLPALNQEKLLVRSEPFSFLVARNLLPRDSIHELQEHFPKLRGAGYLPYEKEDCGESINQLIDEMTSTEFANAIGDHLGVEELAQYPTYISISRSLKKRHGNIHTDGKSKIATALLYLNTDWPTTSDGCLRFLKSIDNYEDTVVPEIKPEYGTLAAFKRADNSFHGHLPYQGERLVIQVAWLVSAKDKARKAKRGRFAHKLKALLGKLGGKSDAVTT
ncbi:2OG-Fe(II) oxygenase [Microbulbifer elongatus]|uniref:2OG-Fe(II) oxygenase n=1 Tax=Microbulbifer elongatus TaxID=86173 RepID=UPI001CFC5C04|nr:2OG-Fe(II) oxygenase [Microbulbifer elongatus]